MKLRTAENFETALAKDSIYPFIPNSAPTTSLEATKVVQGTNLFMQLRAEADKRQDEFNIFISTRVLPLQYGLQNLFF